MRRALPSSTVVMLIGFLLLMHGCATGDKQYASQNLSSQEPVKVCRYETPGILKSTGTETAFLALVTIAAPGGSALLVVGDEYARARGSGTQANIPDFGSLVMNKFIEKIQKERNDLPPFTVLQDPLKEDFTEKCAVMEFKVGRVAYGSLDLTRGGIVLERGLDKGVISTGFLSKTTVSLKDTQGDVLWQKTYLYLSENFDRGMTVEELEADHFALLRDEIEFAAEKTADDFVAHLNGARQEIARARDKE